MTTADQTADRTQDVADAAEYRTMLGKYVDHCEPGGSIQIREDIARKIGGLLARLAEEIETLRRETENCRANCFGGIVEGTRQWVAKERLDAAEAALTAAQEENARLRVEAFNAGLKHVHETLPKPSLTGDDIIAMRDEQDAALSADMPAGGGEPVAVQVKPLEWEEIHQRRSAEDPTTEVVGFEANSGFDAWYWIETRAADFVLHGVDSERKATLHETERAAKAAAQSDYERRIRSALANPPAPAPAVPSWLLDALNRHPLGTSYAIEHDGFRGSVIGYYLTLEGKPGVVMQLTDARVVHVYGEKWLVSPSSQENP